MGVNPSNHMLSWSKQAQMEQIGSNGAKGSVGASNSFHNKYLAPAVGFGHLSKNLVLKEFKWPLIFACGSRKKLVTPFNLNEGRKLMATWSGWKPLHRQNVKFAAARPGPLQKSNWNGSRPSTKCQNCFLIQTKVVPRPWSAAFRPTARQWQMDPVRFKHGQTKGHAIEISQIEPTGLFD